MPPYANFNSCWCGPCGASIWFRTFCGSTRCSPFDFRKLVQTLPELCGHRLPSRSQTERFSPIRVSRAWSRCRAPGLGLEQELVPLTEPEPVGTLRSELVLVVPPRLEWALARAMTSWTELLEVPQALWALQ